MLKFHILPKTRELSIISTRGPNFENKLVWIIQDLSYDLKVKQSNVIHNIYFFQSVFMI